MSSSALREYTSLMQARYSRASKKEKGNLLEEYCRVTGFHRKSAIRALQRVAGPSVERRGRPKTYGCGVSDALLILWKAADFACSKRLAPYLRELVPKLERHGVLRYTPTVREQLMDLSASSIDRLLQPMRMHRLRHPYTSARSTSVVKGSIPIRTFTEWAGVPVGSVQADLVAHCGSSTASFYLTTLVVVDVVTGWTECVPVWGKGESRVGGAADRVRRCLPFPMVGLHCDNGGEFINYSLKGYCERQGIHFSRGRPYKKNDQAWVEQRNWQVVRRAIGYERYATREAYKALDDIYILLRLYMNFFQPISKLVSKERVGAKVRKRYDEARTPYRRLIETGVLEESMRETLHKLYDRLNPVDLLTEMHELIRRLRRMAIVDPITKELLARGSKLADLPQPHRADEAEQVAGA